MTWYWFPSLPLALGLAGILQADDLPEGVVNSQNPDDVSLSPQESLARITVPDGFQVTLFAGEPDLRRPIAFDFDDRGRLWVVENYTHPEWRPENNRDRIVILEDEDQDGRFDQRTVFWDKGRYLTGIALGHGGVWIANTPELAFIPDRNHDDRPDGPPEVRLDGFRISTNNVVNNLHWGPDGWLYGAIGLSSVSRVGAPAEPDDRRVPITRGIWRFHPTDRRFEVVAEGMVNPWGADFNEYGDLLTSNTVIAHLFHIVPGMNCQRRDREPSGPYVYEQIQSITDHLHWGGGVWQSSRTTTEAHSVAGGGHAHCGAMIYLGDDWPETYRGKFFTANLHGNRINMDRLEPRGSSYVGVHGDDFLFGNDPWFRGMSVKYGPDGGVFVSDWHDYGECHDSDGSHRTSGRIYKVTYGGAAYGLGDLRKASSSQLADWHRHPNEWVVRHARRILAERSQSGDRLLGPKQTLRNLFDDASSVAHQLRALWTLYGIDGLTESDLIGWLDHSNEHVRRWAVRFLVDRKVPSPRAHETLVARAAREPSPKVRLALAVALQRVAPQWVVPVARPLLRYTEDATDPYLPLMIWYGLEPAVGNHPSLALELARAARIPKIQRFLIRRLLTADQTKLSQVLQAALLEKTPSTIQSFLEGALDSLEPMGTLSAPVEWARLRKGLASVPGDRLAPLLLRLATLFGDRDAIQSLHEALQAKTAPPEKRRDALKALLRLKDQIGPSDLHPLLANPTPLRGEVIRALLTHGDEATGDQLLEHYPSFSDTERRDAIGVLTSRAGDVDSLLTQLESGRIQRQDVSAFALQQLRAYRNEGLQTRIDHLWTDDRDRLQKSDQIAHYKALMTDSFLASGDVGQGRELFDQVCASCHTLFESGGHLGPDLTGSGRADIDYLLSNLVDPNAVIDDAYRLTTLELKDGRILSGFMDQLGDRFLVFRTVQGAVRLPMSEVQSIETSNLSMMPEGMLQALETDQIRDLILYLRSEDQVDLPQAADRR